MFDAPSVRGNKRLTGRTQNNMGKRCRGVAEGGNLRRLSIKGLLKDKRKENVLAANALEGTKP